LPQKQYIITLNKVNLSITQALKTAEQNPEESIAVVRQCARFALETMPSSDQDSARATSLSQIRTLEMMLAEVRRPDEYLANMREQFGGKLDPRDYKKGLDAFSSIIKSQRQRLYAEGQGFNTPEEKNFCRKRSELLAAIEKAYNLLRDQALGLPRLKTKRASAANSSLDH
jgi:hypothetical protein